jgi:hypothetical protein
MSESRDGNLKTEVGQNNFGEWGWSVLIHTGMRYDDEVGERMIRPGEVVADEDLLWRVVTSGRSKGESEAWASAGDALMVLSLCAARLADSAHERVIALPRGGK